MASESPRREARLGLLPTWSETAANLLKASLGKLGDAFSHESAPVAQRVYNLQGFKVMGDRLLADCRRQRKPLCLAVLDFTDLREAHSVYSKPVIKQLLDATIQRLFDAAGPHGLVAHTASTEFSVVMPGLDLAQGRTALARSLGEPAKIEFSADGAEILLVPDVEVEASGPDIETLHELYTELRINIDQAQDYYRRKAEHLAMQRERAQQPRPPRPQVEGLRPDADFANQAAAESTWPVPLQAEPPAEEQPTSLNITL